MKRTVLKEIIPLEGVTLKVFEYLKCEHERYSQRKVVGNLHTFCCKFFNGKFFKKLCEILSNFK